MREIANYWHAHLSPEIEVKLVTALQKLAALKDTFAFDRWSLCAGTGMSTWRGRVGCLLLFVLPLLLRLPPPPSCPSRCCCSSSSCSSSALPPALGGR